MFRYINEVEKKGLKNRFAKCTCTFPDLNGLMVKGLRMGINVACISTMYCKGKKARSRNEAAKFDWNVTGLRNKRI